MANETTEPWPLGGHQRKGDVRDEEAIARCSSSGPREDDNDELRQRGNASKMETKESTPASHSKSSASSAKSNKLAKDVKDSSPLSCALCPPGTWHLVPHHSLPTWLQDNDYLVKGHRPPLQSTIECLRSIFRIHTETVNIWTHLLGALMFVYFAVYYFWSGSNHGNGEQKLGDESAANGTSDEGAPLIDKMVFLVFFAAAIICLNLSWLFHTMSCHSSEMSILCVKLDYCGIAILIVGSFVPWLYFGFYCSFLTKCLYLSVIVALGLATVTICMWDRFSLPHWRPLRAGVFLVLGLCGIIPALHYSLSQGVVLAVTAGGIGWLLLMGAIFMLGALLYAFRVPERFFPGKCDIVFQSHQIFHVCVVIGCYVQYHGICQLQEYIKSRGVCV